MIFDTYTAYNSNVIEHLNELKKSGQALGCYISVHNEYYESLPNTPFYEDKSVVWVSLGTYSREKCRSDGRLHLLMNVDDLDWMREIDGLFTKVILRDDDLLECVRPYKNLGLLLREHPESELFVEARTRRSGMVINEPSWIDVETGAFATPYEGDRAKYVSRKITVWKNELLPVLTAHLKTLFHEVIYCDTALETYGEYFDTTYSCTNYFQLRGPKVAALKSGMDATFIAKPLYEDADPLSDVEIMIRTLSINPKSQCASQWLEEFDTEKQQKNQGDLELMRRVDSVVRYDNQDYALCRSHVEFLRPDLEYRFPAFPVRPGVIEAMSTGLSDEQLEGLEALQPLPKTKRAQNLVREPKIAHAVQNIGQRMSVAIGAARDKAALSTEQIEAVRTMCQDFKEGITNKAVRELFTELENDPAISSVIVTMLKDDWQDEGALIGVQIKKNRETLTAARRQKILEVARSVSVGAEVREELDTFKQMLLNDVIEGRTVVTPDIAKRYPALYNLREVMSEEERLIWTRQFQRLVNEVYLMQEVRRRHACSSQAGSHIENLFLESLKVGYLTDVQRQARVHEAEVEVIRLLMEGEGIEAASLADLAHLLTIKKMQARLKAAGVCEELVDDLIKVIHNLEEGYATLVASSEPWKSTILGLPEKLPPLALHFLLQNKARGVISKNSKELKKHIQLKAKLLQKGYLEPSDFGALKLRSSLLAWAKDGSLYEDCDKLLVERSTFYKKWGDRIVGEMIQGLDDTDAVLDNGVCFGTTSRWVCNEQKYPHLTAEEFVRVSAIGKITPGDRFRQVYNDLFVVLRGDGDLKTFWPEPFRTQVGMKDAEFLFATESVNSDIAKKVKSEVDKQKEELKISHGTIFLLLSKHVIYIRIDDKRKIYRLFDTNVGLLDFSTSINPEKELYKCFKDLMTLYYPDNDFVAGIQLQL